MDQVRLTVWFVILQDLPSITTAENLLKVQIWVKFASNQLPRLPILAFLAVLFVWVHFFPAVYCRWSSLYFSLGFSCSTPLLSCGVGHGRDECGHKGSPAVCRCDWHYRARWLHNGVELLVGPSGHAEWKQVNNLHAVSGVTPTIKLLDKVLP